MQLLGSSILRNLCFLQFSGSLVSTLDSLLLCLYHIPWLAIFQDGMFHKKKGQISGKMRIDKERPAVLY